MRFLILLFAIFLGFSRASAQEFGADFTFTPEASSLISLNAPEGSFSFAAESNILLDSLNQTFSELEFPSLASQAVSVPEPSAENINALLGTAGTVQQVSHRTFSDIAMPLEALNALLVEPIKPPPAEVQAFVEKTVASLPKALREAIFSASVIFAPDESINAILSILIPESSLRPGSSFSIVGSKSNFRKTVVINLNTYSMPGEYTDNLMREHITHESAHILLDALPFDVYQFLNYMLFKKTPFPKLAIHPGANNFHEAFAYGLERYIFEGGKTDDPQLARYFSLFASILGGVAPGTELQRFAFGPELSKAEIDSLKSFYFLDKAKSELEELIALEKNEIIFNVRGDAKIVAAFEDLQNNLRKEIPALTQQIISSQPSSAEQKKAAEAIARVLQKIEASARYNGAASKIETALKKAGESQQKANASLASTQLYQLAADPAHAIVFARDAANYALEAKKLLGESTLLLHEAAAELKALRADDSSQSKISYELAGYGKRGVPIFRFPIQSPSFALAAKALLLPETFSKIKKSGEVLKSALEKAREKVESAAATQITGGTVDSLAAAKLNKDALAGELRILAEELQASLGQDQGISSRAAEITSNLSFIMDLIRNEKDKLSQEYWALTFKIPGPLELRLAYSMARIRGTDPVSQMFNPILKDLEEVRTQTTGLEPILIELQTPSKELVSNLNNLAAALANIKVSKTSGKLKPVLSFSRDGKNYVGQETFGESPPQVSVALGKPTKLYFSAAKSQGEIAECEWNADLDINSGLSFENRIDRKGECVVELNVTLRSPPYKLYELYTLPVLRLKNKAGEVSEIAQLRLSVVPALKLVVVDGGVRSGMPIEGESLTFWAKVENPDGATVPHRASFGNASTYVDQAPPFEAIPATINASELKPGDSLVFEGTWKNLRPGRYLIEAKVEAERFVYSSFPVFINGEIKSRGDLPKLPDLIISEGPVLVEAEKVEGISERKNRAYLFFKTKIKNAGKSDIKESFKVKANLDLFDDGETYLPVYFYSYADKFSGLLAGEERELLMRSESFILLDDPQARHHLRACVDDTPFLEAEPVHIGGRGSVANEASETNNCASLRFTTAEAKKLELEKESKLPEKKLPPTTPPSVTVTEPPPSLIQRVIDNVQAVVQNVVQAVVNVINPPDTKDGEKLPDLTISEGPSYLRTEKLADGKSWILHSKVKIKNDGEVVAQSFIVRWNLGYDEKNPPFLHEEKIPGLEAGEEREIFTSGHTQLAIADLIPLAIYNLRVCVDQKKSIYEFNEDNNCASVRFDLGELLKEKSGRRSDADIIISSGPTLSLGSLVAGDQVQFKVKIKNRGSTAAVAKESTANPKLEVEFALDYNNDDTTQQTSRVVVPDKTTLAPDEEIEVTSGYIKLRSDPGVVKITVIADSGLNFEEASRGNNKASLVFDVSKKAVSPAEEPFFALENTGDLIINNIDVPEANTLIKIKPFGNFNSPIQFFVDSVTPSIPRAVLRFSPETLVLGQYSAGTILFVSLPAGTPKGLYTVVVRGVSTSGLERLHKVELRVLLEAIKFEFREL